MTDKLAQGYQIISASSADELVNSIKAVLEETHGSNIAFLGGPVVTYGLGDGPIFMQAILVIPSAPAGLVVPSGGKMMARPS